jgi:hypothetical protein
MLAHLSTFVSNFQKLHARFQPKMKPKQDSSKEETTTVPQSLLGSLFQQHPVTSLSFSGDSNSLAVACGSEVILCDSSGWLPIRDSTPGMAIERLRIEYNPPVHQAIYSHDSSILAVATATEADVPEFGVSLYSRVHGSQAWQLRDSLSLANKGEKDTDLALFDSFPGSLIALHSQLNPHCPSPRIPKAL